MRRIAVLLLLAGASLVTSACGTVMSSREKSAAIDLATRFCTAIAQNDEAALAATFTPSLSGLVVQARDQSNQIAAAQPDLPAPLAGGIPYTSQKTDTGCTPGRVQEYGRLSQVELRYPGFEDRLLIVPTGRESWAVNDVLYPAEYQSGMRGAILQAFSE